MFSILECNQKSLNWSYSSNLVNPKILKILIQTIFYGLLSINYCLVKTAAHQPFVTTFCCKFKPKAWQQFNKSGKSVS